MPRQTDGNLPKIFVNSVPKSGTNLLLQVVRGIPGMKQTSEACYDHNFANIANITNGEIAFGHVSYQTQVEALLCDHDIKQVFIYRDLRDVAVSMAHYIEDTLVQHPFHDYALRHGHTWNERLLDVIQGVSNEEVNHPSVFDEFQAIYKWVGAPHTCCVRYEDFMRSQVSRVKTVERIVNFLWADLRHLNMSKRSVIQSMIENIDPQKSFTFRKGIVGEWKHEFTSVHKAAFTKDARDLLVRLGYAKEGSF